MKKLFFLATLLVFLPRLLQAQDKMLFRNGNEINARVLEITTDSVRFAAVDSAGNQTVNLNDVFMITYQNGTKEVFEQMPAPETSLAAGSGINYSRQDLYTLGRRDAKLLFRSSGAFWGTFGATVGGVFIVGPFAGLGVGAACALTSPPEKNIIASDPALKLEPAYRQGYIKQAKSKKLGSAAGGFGAGLGTMTLALFLILASL